MVYLQQQTRYERERDYLSSSLTPWDISDHTKEHGKIDARVYDRSSEAMERAVEAFRLAIKRIRKVEVCSSKQLVTL